MKIQIKLFVAKSSKLPLQLLLHNNSYNFILFDLKNKHLQEWRIYVSICDLSLIALHGVEIHLPCLIYIIHSPKQIPYIHYLLMKI